MILVKNSLTRVLVSPSSSGVESIKFMPGINQIEPEDWSHHGSQSGVKRWIDEGHIVVNDKTISLAKNDKKEGAVRENGLVGLSVKEASEVIKDTLDIALLMQWKAADTRSGVKKSIAAQIKKVEESMKKDEVDLEG